MSLLVAEEGGMGRRKVEAVHLPETAIEHLRVLRNRSHSRLGAQQHRRENSENYANAKPPK
jgi:hypothetical protein